MAKIVLESYDTEKHPDDTHVDVFATAMKAKLAQSRAKGRSGWDNRQLCTDEYLIELLKGHLGKGKRGNWVDIANFCMMLEQRNAEPVKLI